MGGKEDSKRAVPAVVTNKLYLYVTMGVITSYIIALSFEALTLVIVVTNELRGG